MTIRRCNKECPDALQCTHYEEGETCAFLFTEKDDRYIFEEEE